MKEIILAYQGEMTLKGLNRSKFEARLAKSIRYRLEDLGKFKVTQAQSTVFIEPLEDDLDMDEAFRRISKIFGIVKMSRAACCSKDFDEICATAEAYLGETLRGIRSKYGVYACYGNHDIEEPVLAGFTFRQGEKKESDPRMDAFLKEANITLLHDEGTLIDGKFYLYGRPDAHRPGRGVEVRKTPGEITAEMDKSKPIIVLDHQPKELQALADAGVDLDLCGHTHDGQMFPGNLTIKLMWENACGYLQKGKMHNIVTSGVGLFGPNMRVGTKAEICPITVHFAK